MCGIDSRPQLALDFLNEALGELKTSELKSSAAGCLLYKNIILERAALAKQVAPPEELSQAILEVLSLDDISENQRHWAEAILEEHDVSYSQVHDRSMDYELTR